jgi:transposase
MGFVQGEGRTQGTLFPVCLEELIPDDHVCRVIDAFVNRLDMADLGFERAEAAETGRPGYDPRDLLKLYLYGYLQQIRSSRRLELECRRNIELMWLLGRLAPDHKTIAEFRRLHREGVTAAGAELVRLARSVGLIKGEWIAIDGSKFQTVSSARSVREREALERYLEQLEQTDQQDEVVIDPGAVASALEKLRQHPEPEAGFMHSPQGLIPAYNVQAAVDAEHALIVAQQVTDQAADNRSLQPMRNYLGDGTLFDRSEFTYQPESDTFLCPAGQTLARKQLSRKDRAVYYAGQPEVCGSCALKSRCTTGSRRSVTRHLHDEALQRMQQRTTREVMRLRRSIVEHPFANLKYRIFGHPRFLLRGLRGAQTEISLAIAAYNLKRMRNILGGRKLTAALQTA